MKTYHLCWSGGDEVLFRDKEDFRHAIVCLCLAAHKTGSRLLAYCFMSNHVHICIRTNQLAKVIKTFRYAYTRYFNSKYGRRGRLGEKGFFILRLDGLHHILTAISYILRNPLHHGICSTPFEYEYSSVRAAFRKELGFAHKVTYILDEKQYHFLPDGNKLPRWAKMDETGLLLPESIIDVNDLEHMFSTARTYIYYMNRLSNETWEKEQDEDKNGRSPIKLEDIEEGVRTHNIRTLLANEHGRADYRATTDLEICRIIDTVLVPASGAATVYSMSMEQRKSCEQYLVNKYHLPKEQIKRCMGGDAGI